MIKAVPAVLAAAVLASACSGGKAAQPFSTGASAKGYTVLYARSNPNKADPAGGPCGEIVPASQVAKYLPGTIGAVTCPDMNKLDVEVLRLDGGQFAVWGLKFSPISKITVAGYAATTKGNTYLAVIPAPSGVWKVEAYSSAGTKVAEVASTTLAPQVPIVN